MSTKIRPIKCPNCGSEKHVQLGDKLYRCKSCGTEYFLDDDDITVHVKHHFDNGGFSSFNGSSNVSITSIAKVFAIIGVITFFLLFMIIYGLRSSSPSVSSRDS
ncbi:transposase, partial [Prevotella jejuni]